MSVYYNENDGYPVEWLKNLISAGHIAPGVVDGRSIKDVAPADVRGASQAHFFAGIGVWSHALRLAGWPDDCPVWTGSCPCQPFSSAGIGRGTDDERHLWPVWFELIKERRPPVIFGEQVSSPDALEWFDHVSADLEGEGYAIGAADLSAASVGAPHVRQRLYFVAYAPEPGWHARWGRSVASDGGAQAWLEPRRLRDAGELADANGRAGEQGRALTARGDHRSDAQSWPGPRGGVSAGSVADAPGGGLNPRSVDETRGEAAGERERGPESREYGGAGELAHANGERHEGRLHVRLRGPRAHLLEALGNGQTRGVGYSNSVRGPWYGRASDGAQESGGSERHAYRVVDDGALASGATRFVGDSSSEGLAGRSSEPGDDGAQREAAQRAGGATRGFWSDADWRYCLDGKWRPTEPGVEPLAHRTSGRVVVVRTVVKGGSPVQEAHWYSASGSIKGYGNAIVAPLAATFVRAFMDVVAEL